MKLCIKKVTMLTTAASIFLCFIEHASSTSSSFIFSSHIHHTIPLSTKFVTICLFYLGGSSIFLVPFFGALGWWSLIYEIDRILSCWLLILYCAYLQASLGIDLLGCRVPGGLLGQNLIKIANSLGNAIIVDSICTILPLALIIIITRTAIFSMATAIVLFGQKIQRHLTAS